jgi:hypothetical protein
MIRRFTLDQRLSSYDAATVSDLLKTALLSTTDIQAHIS